MKKSRFDEFINLYDGKTKGKYTYYYKHLWYACHNAEECYREKHKVHLWENMNYKSEWVRAFENYLSSNNMPEELQQSINGELTDWLEAVK